MGSGLAELVRRDVLELSADPLSPQRGTYRFRQEMLRQVAYDTLSRRDRKTRHLAVAANLRAVFANDGGEFAEVIARHYLDAIDSASEDSDAPDIRALSVEFLIRAADRSLLAGAPAPAAASYATAAELISGANAAVTDAV
jgi:predicted ATPase